jgi:shikimate dehydrogenase
MRDDEHPVPIVALPPDAAVFDLVYRAHETAWVRAAREAGHRAADGEGMLVEQGALAFERWFGVPPDRNAMWKAMH